MKKKRLLKGIIFGLAFTAIIVLTYSAGFGQWTQDYSVDIVNPFNLYNFDSSSTFSPWAQTSNYNQNFSNLYANTSSMGYSYNDLFSSAATQSFAYENMFGFSLETGQGYYADPVYSIGAKYTDVDTWNASFMTQNVSERSVVGASDYYGSSFENPWTSFSSEGTTATGMYAGPYGSISSGASLAYGKPTLFSFSGSRDAEAILNLITYGPSMNQIGAAMANEVMYTTEGMAFVGNPWYFNPHNATNWYFAPGAQTSVTATP